MFSEFETQVWSLSATGVAISNNTDFSIDGSSKKIVWTESEKSATLTFDSVDLSEWEEISVHLYVRGTLSTNLFTMTLSGETFTFTRKDFGNKDWTHMLIDCSKMTDTTSIVFTSIAADLTLFVDYAGYRKVTYNCDVDIIEALKSHINLDYGVSTTLTASAPIGTTSIAFIKSGIEGYVNDTTLMELDDGAGTTETVSLINRSGLLSEATTSAFAIGNTARILCPVRSEDYDDIQPDPICGIVVYDLSVDKQLTTVYTKNGSKLKQYLGDLGIAVYIDCKSLKKLLQMSREYNKKYGEEFQFLLDGERVNIYLSDESVFSDSIIGNNPRMMYYYRLQPQPYLYAGSEKMQTITLSTTVSG